MGNGGSSYNVTLDSLQWKRELLCILVESLTVALSGGHYSLGLLFSPVY